MVTLTMIMMMVTVNVKVLVKKDADVAVMVATSALYKRDRSNCNFLPGYTHCILPFTYVIGVLEQWSVTLLPLKFTSLCHSKLHHMSEHIVQFEVEL